MITSAVFCGFPAFFTSALKATQSASAFVANCSLVKGLLLLPPPQLERTSTRPIASRPTIPSLRFFISFLLVLGRPSARARHCLCLNYLASARWTRGAGARSGADGRLG